MTLCLLSITSPSPNLPLLPSSFLAKFWRSLRLSGQAWPSTMYLCGGEAVQVDRESLASSLPPSEGQPPQPKPLLVLFLCPRKEVGESEERGPVTRKLEIGCIKTPLVKKVLQ